MAFDFYNWWNSLNEYSDPNTGLTWREEPSPTQNNYPINTGTSNSNYPSVDDAIANNYKNIMELRNRGATNNTTSNRSYSNTNNDAWKIAQLNDARERELAAQQLAWYREQLAAQEATKREERLATLAAQPKSWLEYAALQGQAPVVQEWMKPLMQGDYRNLQTGEAIPGWTAQNMMGMPDLLTPSAQLLARMSPTAREQYLGYMQADTGAPADTTQWKNWSQAPVGSQSYRGLQQVR